MFYNRHVNRKKTQICQSRGQKVLERVGLGAEWEPVLDSTQVPPPGSLSNELIHLHRQRLSETECRSKRVELEQIYRAHMLEVAQLEFENIRKKALVLSRYEGEVARISRTEVEVPRRQLTMTTDTLVPIIKKTRVQEPVKKPRSKSAAQKDISDISSTEASSLESAWETDQVNSESDEAEDFT